MTATELGILTGVLTDRDLLFVKSATTSALEESETRDQTRKWIKKYLNEATLLSREDRVFLDSDDQTARRKGASIQMSTEEVENAIAHLESSTAAIEAQNQILQAQKSALMKVKERCSGNEVTQVHQDRQRRLTKDKAQLDFHVDELSTSIHERLQASAKKTQSTATGFSSTTDRILEKDDRVLDGLQKTVPRLDGLNREQASFDDVESLCQSFAALEGQAIRSRIDHTYKQTLRLRKPSINGTNSSHDIDKEERAIRAELDELCGEIDGLVTLVADNHFRGPIMKSLQRANFDASGESAKWSEYTACVLLYLTARLEALDEHLRHIYVHQAALESLSNELEKAFATPKNKNHVETAHAPTSVTLHRGLKPLRLVQANFSEISDPTVQLLRLLDIKDSGHGDPAATQAILSDATGDRLGKVALLETATEQTIRRQMARSFADIEATTQQLSGATHAHSQNGTVDLVDERLVAGLEGMEDRTQQLSERMQTLEMERLSKFVKAKQEVILRL